jgi:hypothetical protein
VLSFAITNDHITEAKIVKKLLESLNRRIKKIFGEMGYDSRELFNQLGSAAVMPPRMNAFSQVRRYLQGHE